MEAAAVAPMRHPVPCRACGYLYGSEPHECATGDPCPYCHCHVVCSTCCPETSVRVAKASTAGWLCTPSALRSLRADATTVKRQARDLLAYWEDEKRAEVA